MTRIAAALLATTLLVPAAQAQEQRIKTEKAEVIVETVARGLEHPWGLAFLPDGRMLVTERPGRLRVVGKDGQLSRPIQPGLPLAARGQGGLLDVAVDPNFAQNRTIYMSLAEDRGEGRAATSVVRAVLNEAGTDIENPRPIFRQEPTYAGGNHYGSRLVFDRQGNLFVTTGDRFNLSDQAQNPANHIGKVIRITSEGRPAPGNPFLGREGARPEIWSLATATYSPPPFTPKPGNSGPSSTGRAAATRSTSQKPARTTAGR